MSVFLRPLPGGLFPRLVALLPLLFPLYVVQGIFLGVPVTLPEVFLAAILFYFLFEHESFRRHEWKLWPVPLFVLGLGIWTLQLGLGLEGLKTVLLFPLLYFVMARSIFREKASMLLLSQRAFMVAALFLALSVVQTFLSRGGGVLPLEAPFGGEGALLVIFGSAFVLSFLRSVFFSSKQDLLFSLGVLLMTGIALILLQALWVFWVVLFCLGISALLRLPKRVWRLLAVGIWSLVFYGGLFWLHQKGFLLLPPLPFFDSFPGFFALILLFSSGLWLLAKTLPWIQERDIQGRFALATSLLCFGLLAFLEWPHLTASHAFLFWFFMASLL
ncbi:hypothetical protein IPG41_01605 [Candidatus Peregrinibacteria bacterium]|nr:MAG: hypothetical protein IPG41_01605 [Candidatus Peregrinibacteria bacterium]